MHHISRSLLAVTAASTTKLTLRKLRQPDAASDNTMTASSAGTDLERWWSLSGKR